MYMEGMAVTVFPTLRRRGIDLEIRMGPRDIILHPNIHLILAVSSVCLIGFLAFELLHAHASIIVIMEILHFFGWAWVEFPEVIEIA